MRPQKEKEVKASLSGHLVFLSSVLTISHPTRYVRKISTFFSPMENEFSRRTSPPSQSIDTEVYRERERGRLKEQEEERPTRGGK